MTVSNKATKAFVSVNRTATKSIITYLTICIKMICIMLIVNYQITTYRLRMNWLSFSPCSRFSFRLRR